VVRELSEGGHQAFFTADAIEALMLLRSRPFAAAVLDAELPPPGGLGLLARLRAEEATRNLPVLLVAPSGGSVAAEECRKNSAVPLERPVTALAVNAALGPMLAVVGGGRMAVGGSADEVLPPPTADRLPPAAQEWALKMRKLCHDLNNSLAVITGQLEIIAERHPDLPADLAKRMTDMRKASEDIKQAIRRAGEDARETCRRPGASE
jgi:CheY-like chemotaxis protein